MTPDLCSDKEEADRVGFDSTDQELLAGILEHAPSLLDENWITHEDAVH